MLNFKKLALIATEIQGKTSLEMATEPKTVPPNIYQKQAGGNVSEKQAGGNKSLDVSITFKWFKLLTISHAT